MASEESKKLDNPVWFSLTESHQRFTMNHGATKFYHPDYCPFGAFTGAADTIQPIDAYAKLVDRFFMVGEKPQISKQLTLKNELVCLQMTIDHRVDLETKETIIPLTQQHTDALVDLVTLVLPGYFKRKTLLLGNYYGIFRDGQLVAVTGERMQMDAFIEVSAVVTHPHYTGQGYAQQLIAHTVNNIFDQHKKPYLHVAANNMGAIRVYEKLGFTTRRKMSFWNITT
jgi:ribosomal protein S18 acetylase RimI-like enzyme